jgi:hypothetical protein
VRVALFDWTAGGHHSLYARLFAEALSPIADVLLAVPDDMAADVADVEAEMILLGPARGKASGLGRRAVLDAEVRHLHAVAARADRVLHLHADKVVPHLAFSARSPTPVSILLFYPRAHYPSAFGDKLPPRDRAIALLKDLTVRKWRRRGDAQAVLTLDEEAAQRWRNGDGAPAFWLSEPPVPQLAQAPGEPAGCVVWGALAPRKGIDLLADALTLAPTSLRVVLAGRPSQGFLPELERLAQRMRKSGADVDVRAQWLAYQDGLLALAEARCAVLPYPNHAGMSRVLLEACAVGTPVVAHSFGLLGHLVEKYALGRSVDCRDPVALRDAVLELTSDGARENWCPALERFTARFTQHAFQETLVDALGLGRRSFGNREPALR